MLTRPHPPPDETLTLPPHLRPHHSLCFRTPASSSPQLTFLTLLQGPQVMPPTLPSPSLKPPRTCLILSDAYHPYARGHPQDETMIPGPLSALPPLTLLQPCLIFSATFNSYAHAAPSRYVSNAALNALYA
ncbi:hypothetical protein O181_096765 [Austropuccinia psidii MF-1]|uniref:Uncharacterized protein n=1 Tax=Austropuccinia psidii MF-1 TaxID=1389203 RepID=A0A9Q3J894_9BASI|nr:hypothetical protein [Austropuccinia psidii MF-1]